MKLNKHLFPVTRPTQFTMETETKENKKVTYCLCPRLNLFIIIFLCKKNYRYYFLLL